MSLSLLNHHIRISGCCCWLGAQHIDLYLVWLCAASFPAFLCHDRWALPGPRPSGPKSHLFLLAVSCDASIFICIIDLTHANFHSSQIQRFECIPEWGPRQLAFCWVHRRRSRRQRLPLYHLLDDLRLFEADTPSYLLALPLKHYLQVQNSSLTTLARMVGTALGHSSSYYMQVLSFKALASPFLRLLVPDGNVRFYWLRYDRIKHANGTLCNICGHKTPNNSPSVKMIRHVFLHFSKRMITID